MNINSVAIQKVSTAIEIRKYLFLKTVSGHKIWGKMVADIKEMGGIMKDKIFNFPRR